MSAPSDLRLRRTDRLRSSAEFRRVFDGGSVHVGSLVVLHVLPAPETLRYGVVAGRKVGNAVRRNRAKRLLRETLRRTRPTLPSFGYLLVVVARARAAHATQVQVEGEFHRLVREAGLANPAGQLTADSSEP